MMMLARSLTTLALLLALVPAATARPREAGKTPLEQAREESPAARGPALRSSVVGAPGAFFAKPSEYLAASRSDITLVLDPKGASAGALAVDLPSTFMRKVPSGLDTIGTPSVGGGATLTRSGGRLTIDLSGVQAGRLVELTIPDRGIPAGTYALRVSHIDSGGRERALGSVSVRLYAPVREASVEDSGWQDLRVTNVTNDATTQSETFITAVPGNPLRVLAGANGGAYSAWLSTDGGTTFTKKTLPPALDVQAGDSGVGQKMCCDPMSAANREGDIWYGGLSFDVNNSGFIVVNRIAAGETSFRPVTVGIPRRKYSGFAGVQDKPMMTIDNSVSSPTFGRLYVSWGEPEAGVNIVVSQCDTRPNGGALDAARCDEADNWSPPADITKSEGGYIYADVAVGPDGVVYAVWWDYSSENSIRGATCNPAVVSCSTAGGWSAAKTIAVLDRENNAPIPFACPIVAQPGGRAGPDPQVETDISATDSRGRVYVTWSDLRANSGSTRCAQNQNGTATTPLATHDSWDSFVASAANALPGSVAASATVGTRLLTDGEGGGQASSDDWFPWLAVDQTTGVAYAAFYSTRLDATRKTTHFYLRTVTAGGVGPLEQVSTAPSDYSEITPQNQCCNFRNDYGDYTGVDATCGAAFPIWSDKSGTNGLDGEAFVQRQDGGPVPCLVLAATQATEVVGLSDGDGSPEPGETVDVLPTLRNAGAAEAQPSSATLTTIGQAQILDGEAAFPAVAPGATAVADSPFRVRLDRAAVCSGIVSFTSVVTGGSYTARLTLPLRAQGVGGLCRVAPKAALTASTPSAQTVQPVVFDAGATQDLDGTIARYEWDFDGDGTTDQTTTTASTSTSYPTAGTRTVKVRAVDDDGDTGEATLALPVTAPPPPPPPVAPTITLAEAGKKKRADRKRRVKLAVVTCARCTGSLVLKSSGKVRSGRKRVVLKLGTLKFVAGDDGKARLTLVLSKKTYALVRKLKRVKVSVALSTLSPEKLGAKGIATFTLVK